MYVLIDTDTMHVVAKHPNWQRLCNLGILVCSESSAVIPLEAREIGKEFDDVQLQLLYINVTKNHEGAAYARNVVTKILQYYFNKMPESVIGADVDDQAYWAITNGKEGDCNYVPKSTKPEELSGERTYPVLMPETSTELAIEKGQPVVTTQGQQGAWSPARETSATNTPVRSGNSTAPRASGTREVIFAKADEMWEAAGKPTDKPLILKLRKEIMDALELDGVKRNTSSNTLGNWQKERVG